VAANNLLELQQTLGLEPAVDVQEWSTYLDQLRDFTADLDSGNAQKFVHHTGSVWEKRSASQMRDLLDLEVNTDVQGYDANLTTLGAGGAPALTFLGLGDAAVEDIVPVAKGGTGSANAADAQVELELEPGVNVQEWSTNLDSWDVLCSAIVSANVSAYPHYNGAGGWRNRTPTETRIDLGLGSAATLDATATGAGGGLPKINDDGGGKLSITFPIATTALTANEANFGRLFFKSAGTTLTAGSFGLYYIGRYANMGAWVYETITVHEHTWT
jgi:hypothetical protein